VLKGVGDRFVVDEEGEVARFQRVAEMLYGLVDGHQLAVVCTVFLLGRVEVLGKESCSAAFLVEVEASVTSASGEDGGSVSVGWSVRNSPCTLRRPCGVPVSR
jgi:hypothetical protein